VFTIFRRCSRGTVVILSCFAPGGQGPLSGISGRPVGDARVILPRFPHGGQGPFSGDCRYPRAVVIVFFPNWPGGSD